MAIYTCKISSERSCPQAFAVALLAMPPFPDGQPIKPGVRTPLVAVVAANDDGGAWGYITLNEREKRCIGDALVQMQAGIAEWKWCELYETSSNPV